MDKLLDGSYKAKILKTTLDTSQSGKLYCQATLQIEDKEVPAFIWLTEKGLGTARQALLKCGFDVDNEDLNLLKAAPEMLAGNEVLVDVSTSTYNNEERQDVRIVTKPPLTKNMLSAAQAGLRKAKRDDEAPVVDVPVIEVPVVDVPEPKDEIPF